MGSVRRNIDEYTGGNLSSVGLIEVGDIPGWMLWEVLMRLPVKVLFKFKIVSKQWLSVISDPLFARMYVARTLRFPHSQPWALFCFLVDVVMIKQFLGQRRTPCASSLGINFPCQCISPKYLHYIIVGVSNGLVLLYGFGALFGRSGEVGCYHLCNPITGQWIALPPLDHRSAVFATGFVTKVEDNALASYRVVRIDNYDSRSSVFRFLVYVSEMSKWTDCNIDFKQEIYFNTRKQRAAHGQILHWTTDGHRIVAYDPYNKPDSFRLISLPGVPNAEDEFIFDEHIGRLRYLKVRFYEHERANEVSHGLSIWILNDYDSGEWCLQHRINIQCDGCLRDGCLPLSFHPFDSNIVYMFTSDALYAYDVQTKKLEAVDDSGTIYGRIYDCWSFLFIPPAWPVSMKPSSFEVTKD